MINIRTTVFDPNTEYTLVSDSITGFNPDPSCIFGPELDDIFFCAMSSFLAFLGLPINANKDLVHWKHVSKALSRVDQLLGVPFLPKMTSGIYAPTLRSTRRLSTSFDAGQSGSVAGQRFPLDNFLLTTSDPFHSGPWSDPFHFSFPRFDPTAFRDDGSTYISGAHKDHVPPRGHARPMDLETRFGHTNLFQDANGNWWAAALAVRAGGNYGNVPYFAYFPMGHERMLTPVMEKGKGTLNGVSDLVSFSPVSKLPIYFIHHRLPKSQNYVVSPPDHPNTLALGSSALNLTGFDCDFARGPREDLRRPTDGILAVPVPRGGPAEHQYESQLCVFGYCSGDEMVSYYSGLLLGVYATSNGKHEERAFETYVSDLNYTGTQRFRRQDDVDESNGEECL
ncbi:hypothetical protein DL770_007842 [Monosporascus sp. CRB-9-2]|nr:hypothetical protein DL770_007842 [Monosporascus sp. CRB-9-2]